MKKMTPSNTKNSQFENLKNTSLKELAELAKKGAIYTQIEDLWGTLFKNNIEEIIGAPEFKKEGLAFLIKHVETLASPGPEKKKLLDRLVFLRDNNERLIKLLDHEKKPRESFRHSGHFIDQKLKYEYPKQDQITIFDLIKSDPLKKKVDKYNFEVKAIGVRLTAPEDKLLNALQKLLHNKSQSNEPESADYYKGNETPDIVPFGKEKKESPMLRIKPGELYRAYLNNDSYSGLDIKFIRDTLMNLSAKKFLMIFDRKRQVEKNGKTRILTDRIEEFQSLVRVIKFTQGIDEKELKNINSGNESVFESKGELIIGFNPILVEQINSKYIEYPSNINRRMILAAGGHRLVTEAMNLLRDYMLRELASKRTTIEINQERLPHLLKLTKYIEARQKKRVEKRVSDAIQATKNLGILSSMELVKGSAGQMKYIFHLNSEFQ